MYIKITSYNWMILTYCAIMGLLKKKKKKYLFISMRMMID